MPDWDVVEGVADVKGHPGDCFSVLACGRKVQGFANRFPESGEHNEEEGKEANVQEELAEPAEPSEKT